MTSSLDSRPCLKHSPAEIPQTIRYREAPLYSLLEESAARHPDLTAVRF